MASDTTVQRIGQPTHQMGSSISSKRQFRSGSVVLPESGTRLGGGIKKSAFAETGEFGRPKSAAFSARKIEPVKTGDRPATTDAAIVRDPRLPSTTESSPLTGSPSHHHHRLDSKDSIDSPPSSHPIQTLPSPAAFDRKGKEDSIGLMLPPREAVPAMAPQDTTVAVYENEIIDRDAIRILRELHPDLTDLSLINCTLVNDAVEYLVFANLTALDLSGSKIQKVTKEIQITQPKAPSKKKVEGKRPSNVGVSSPKSPKPGVPKASSPKSPKLSLEEGAIEKYPWITRNLKTLRLQGWKNFQPLVKQRLDLVNLETFDVGMSAITHDQFEALVPNLGKVTSLDMNMCTNFSMNTIRLLLHMPSLQKLSLNATPINDDNGVSFGKEFALFCGQTQQLSMNLQELSLNGSILTSEHINGISRIKSLKKLSLVRVRFFDREEEVSNGNSGKKKVDWDSRLKPFHDLPNLEELDVTDADASLKGQPDAREILQRELPNPIISRPPRKVKNKEAYLQGRQLKKLRELMKSPENVQIVLSMVHAVLKQTVFTVESLTENMKEDAKAVHILNGVLSYIHPRETVRMDVESLRRFVLEKEQAKKAVKVINGDQSFQGIVLEPQIQILTEEMQSLSLQPSQGNGTLAQPNGAHSPKEGHNKPAAPVPAAPQQSYLQKLCAAISFCWTECGCRELCTDCSLCCRDIQQICSEGCHECRHGCPTCRQMSCEDRCQAIFRCINSFK